jgi:hypothetical protein
VLASERSSSVRYEAVNAMLLNEFLKAHRKAQDQDRKVQELEATAARQQEQIEALTAGLQKVSGQVEMSRPAPHCLASLAQEARIAALPTE